MLFLQFQARNHSQVVRVDIVEDHKYFTKIDLLDAYMQFEIDEESKLLLAINTPKGLYACNRLTPGIKPDACAFQEAIDRIICGVTEATSYFDDVMVANRTKEEHKRSVRAVLSRFADYNLTVNLSKCEFMKTTVRYLGHVVDGNGIYPDDAILNLPPPMDRLLKKGVEFSWDEECQERFEQFKMILTSNLVLIHYDPELPVVLSADASKEDLGATLQHKLSDGSAKVIAYASRSLTPEEKNYSQIEKEGLSIMFGLKKYHKYIFGRPFLIRTDHKPLLAILKPRKGVPAHSATRLQRWALTLAAYDFQIKYIPAAEFSNADVLSRLIGNTKQNDEEFAVASIKIQETLQESIIANLASFPVTFDVIKSETSKDSPL